jgi:hypothetical protein
MMSFEGRRRWRQQQLFKLCAKPRRHESSIHFKRLRRLLEIFAERIRIQNLRFAYSLCAAQEMGGITKSEPI